MSNSCQGKGDQEGEFSFQQVSAVDEIRLSCDTHCLSDHGDPGQAGEDPGFQGGEERLLEKDCHLMNNPQDFENLIVEEQNAVTLSLCNNFSSPKVQNSTNPTYYTSSGGMA